MVVSRRKLLLTAVACLIMAPLPIITGMDESSPAGLASPLAAIPLSAWIGLVTMLVLIVVSWLSIEHDNGESGE